MTYEMNGDQDLLLLAKWRRLAASEGRMLRLKAGLTTTAVGREIGTSHSAVSLWERGMGRKPSGLKGLAYAKLMERLANEVLVTARLDMAMVGLDDLLDVGPVPIDRDARLLWIEMLAWSCTYSTDGHFPARALRQITDHPDPDAGIATLVKVGRLTARADGWNIAGFADRQMDSSDKERMRRAGAERSRRWREKRFGDGADSGAAKRASNGATNGVGDAVDNGDLSLAKRSEAKRSHAKTGQSARSASPALRSGSAALAQPRAVAEALAMEVGVAVEGANEDLTDEQGAVGGYCGVCGLLARHEDLMPVYLSTSEVDELVHREGCIDSPLVVEVID